MNSESLLTITQAAKMLNVSEVSLRRWTNAGRLNCVRVGGRRERRFQRQELLAFLEKTEQTRSTSDRVRPPKVGQIQIEGMAIEHGDHLGAFYENDAGRIKLAVPFLADGLLAGDVCCLVAARTAMDHIVHHLARARGELDDDLARGKLLLMAGRPSGDAHLTSLENVFMESTRVGGRSLRVLGDMSWCFEVGMDPDTLMDFERRYHQVLARRFPVVTICQYDARRFTGVSILQVLRIHEDTFRYPLGRFLN